MEQNPNNRVQGNTSGQPAPPSNYQQPVNGQFQPQYQNAAYYRAAAPQPKKHTSLLPVFIILMLLVLGLVVGNIFLLKHFIDKKKADKVALNGSNKSSFSQTSLSYDDNGDFRLLSGTFKDKATSQDEALGFISRHSQEIGIKDADSELSFTEEQSDGGYKCYKFDQVWQGVPVYGNDLIVTVDSEGVVKAVNGTYTSVDISTDAAISLEEAENTSVGYAGEGSMIMSSRLVVVPCTESGSARLAYSVSVLGADKSAALLIDAQSGEIFSESDLFSAITENVTVDSYGKLYNVDLEKTGDNDYTICDIERDIIVTDGRSTSVNLTEFFSGALVGKKPFLGYVWMHNDDGSVKMFVTPEPDLISVAKQIQPPFSSDKSSLTDKMLVDYSIGSLCSVKNAYDFYNNVLGWKSFDGNGLPIRIAVGIKEPFLDRDITGYDSLDLPIVIFRSLPSIKSWEGAAYIPGSGIIIIGALEQEPLIGQGILGHEFTHAVFERRVQRVPGDIQALTVDEGYADVMGSVISGNWVFMMNEIPSDFERYNEVIRNPIAPNLYENPAKMSDEYFDKEPTDEHKNATIISHSGYLMTKNGLSDDEVAELFFRSMKFLSHKPDFDEVTNALLMAADDLSFSADKKKAVSDALIETEMLTPKGKIRVHVQSGKWNIKNATVSINGKKVGKTDRKGTLLLDFDSAWIGNVTISVSAVGFESDSREIKFCGNKQDVFFGLSKKGSVHDGDEDMVKITMIQMTDASERDMENAEVYYVEKGSTIDLNDIVDVLGVIGISTDGTKLYFANKDVPVELTYCIYGTDEVFDFSQPVEEDVIIEPVFGVGGENLSFQDLRDIKEAFEELFDIELTTKSVG